MAPRWEYEQASVAVGRNSVTVRELTDGERARFAAAGKDAQVDRLSLLSLLVSMAMVEPVVTQEAAREMPARLLDAAAQRIMALSGLEVEPGPVVEKKA